MAFIHNNTVTAFDSLGLACCGSEYYSPLLFGCCDLGRRKHVYSRLTDCCVKGEDVYGREESWPVKICFGNMGYGPIGHAWVESAEVAWGFYARPKRKLVPKVIPALDIGIWQGEVTYPLKKEVSLPFKYWFNDDVKYCIPIHLSKCRFDIDKFNSCLRTERPMAFYSIFSEIDAYSPIFLDKTGMGLAILLPNFIDFLSIPFNISPIKDCHTGAYAMIAKCARKSKR